MFPFISEEKSIEIIEEFERFDETKHFISYFVLSYLNRYNFKDKNVSTKSSKETITKHVVESHNNILRKAMYLNIWDFDNSPSKSSREVGCKAVGSLNQWIARIGYQNTLPWMQLCRRSLKILYLTDEWFFFIISHPNERWIMIHISFLSFLPFKWIL